MPKFEVMNTNAEEAELAEGFLRECHEKGIQPIEGELEKTEEDLTMLAEVNTMLTSVADRFNLKKETIDSRSVHVLPAEAFLKQTTYKTAGMYKAKFESILLNDDLLKDKSKRISTLLHESLHAISHQKFFLQEDGTLEPYRVGYGNNPIRGGRWFDGLNEMVIVFTESTLMRAHADELQRKFVITEEEIAQTAKENECLEVFLHHILNKVGKYRNEDFVTTADRFVKGHFTGEMLHLKDIEKVYGPHSLRILAMLDDGHNLNSQRVPLRRMIVQYFIEADDTSRKELSTAIIKQFEQVLESERSEKKEGEVTN